MGKLGNNLSTKLKDMENALNQNIDDKKYVSEKRLLFLARRADIAEQTHLFRYSNNPKQE